MNINGTSATGQVSPLTAVTNTPTTNRTSSLPPPGIGEAAVPSMSGPGKLMSKLAQLKAADPDKFQAVVSDMASKLKDAASQATGPQAQFLTNMANKLGDIANGGDISELRPPAGGAQGGAHGVHHGGHHHHGGGGVGGSADSSDASSQDNVKSVAESIFGELDSALNGVSSSSSTSNT